MNIELRIGGKLCDVGSLSQVRILMRRVLFAVGELYSKDSNSSYELTLPFTPANNDVFEHANIEETTEKFHLYSDCKLYADDICILDGQCHLKRVGESGYVVNIVVYSPKSLTEIFGELTLNQAGAWAMDFLGPETITEMNNQDNPRCIFPLALYGLLPKVPNDGTFTSKTLIDDSVLFSYRDFAPSVNCLQMMRQIFTNAGYNLSGTAFDDPKLSRLYMSYKNPADYNPYWGVGKVDFDLQWNVFYVGIGPQLELNRVLTRLGEINTVASVNLFDGFNTILTDNSGGNSFLRRDANRRIHIEVPVSGLYKITHHTEFEYTDLTGTFGRVTVAQGDLDTVRTEVKLVRNFDDNLQNIGFDNIFSEPNIFQPNPGQGQYLYPQEAKTNFIDPKVNAGLVNGFAFGFAKGDLASLILYNILNQDNHQVNPMAITGGRSWDENVSYRAFSAVDSPGYRLGTGEETETPRMVIDMINEPAASEAYASDLHNASGDISQVIWLEAGETLDLVATSFVSGADLSQGSFTWYNHSIRSHITIEPFRRSKNWLKVDQNNNSTGQMNWDDAKQFDESRLDLIQFLPSEMKIDEWIDNFCKAFNLKIYGTGGNKYRLDIKDRAIVRNTSKVIDLDSRASVTRRQNEPLLIPYVYELGFTVDTKEEGYYASIPVDEEGEKLVFNGGYTGKGVFYTNSGQANKITHTSNFSYCWYKDFTDSAGNTIPVPVISDHEIWEYDESDYLEQLDKLYFDKPLRFWFKQGTYKVRVNNVETDLALVGNEYHNGANALILDYENKRGSIMKNFFFLFDNSRHYTTIHCHLTPEEYADLHISLVKFNGDIYNVYFVDKYDPIGKSPAEVHLIRRIIW